MRLKLLFLLVLLFPTLLYGQGAQLNTVIFGPTGRPAPGVFYTVCSANSPGIPCTNTVNLFSDPALTVARSNPVISDGLGNVTFYAPPGVYTYTLTGGGVTASGPFVLVLPCVLGAACGSGQSTSLARLSLLGTLLSSGDFAFNGWGAGATLGGIVGTDSAFNVTVTAGTAPSLNPTVTLTFHDGPWNRIDGVDALCCKPGTGVSTDIQSVNNLSSLTLTFLDLPVATKTYTFNVIVTGLSDVIPSGSVVNPVVKNPTAVQTVVGAGNALILDGSTPFQANGGATFGLGLTGTGTIGTLDLGTGALNSSHTWALAQVFPDASIAASKMIPGLNGQCFTTTGGVSAWGACSASLSFNGSSVVGAVNFSDTLPAAPPSSLNIKWQSAGGNASGSVAISGNSTTVCSVSGTLNSGHIVVVDASGNCVDGGFEQWTSNITSNTCPTSGTSFDTCTYTLTWPTAFASNTYKAVCTGLTPHDNDNSDAGRLIQNGISAQTTTTVTFKISSAGASHVLFSGGVVCHAKL